ncbi:MAG: formylglycine-generating enzyme family protein [Thermomicrobiales bacterium]
MTANLDADADVALPMVAIPGGTFLMGSDNHYVEERPATPVSVEPFWLSSHAVTNAEFARFVAATGYITVAERPLDPAAFPTVPPSLLQPGSMVFVATDRPVPLHDNAQWWRWTPGASWKHPRGPGSSIATMGQHPVVQIALEDAETYAAWCDARLPTEAEWEFAARGGLDGATFTWGNEDMDDGTPRANVWIGAFPWHSARPRGAVGTTPVGTFDPNGYGLYDMAGNVWEWTADWWTSRRSVEPGCPCCGGGGGRFRPVSQLASQDATTRIAQRVVKGGSHLCHRDACFRYRPAARQPQQIDTGMSHLGFRLARTASPARPNP